MAIETDEVSEKIPTAPQPQAEMTREAYGARHTDTRSPDNASSSLPHLEIIGSTDRYSFNQHTPRPEEQSKDAQNQAKDSDKDQSQQAEADRNKYQNEVTKQIDANNKSLPVKSGEGYYQVLERMYPDMPHSQVAALARECKAMNGGRGLSKGDQFKILTDEQKLRLTDQIMNDYDARHKTDALDTHGDFAAEKGKKAKAHNELRDGLAKQIEGSLKSFEPKDQDSKAPDTKAPDKTPSDQAPEKDPKPAKEVEKLSMDEFSPEAKKLFADVDKNRDGIMSGGELRWASRNPVLNDKEKQLLAGLLKAGKDISKMSTDEKDCGISMQDLDALDTAYQQEKSIKTANELVAKPGMYESLDENRDGYLSNKELEEAMKSRTDLKEEQIKALKYLLDNFNTTANIYNDGWFFADNKISKKDISGLSEKSSQSDDGKIVSAIDQAITEMYGRQKQI